MMIHARLDTLGDRNGTEALVGAIRGAVAWGEDSDRGPIPQPHELLGV